MTDSDGLIVESHGTNGAYNAYGRLAYNIRYDEKKEFCSGSLYAGNIASPKHGKKTSGGIIVIANGSEVVDDCNHKEVLMITEALKMAAKKGLDGSWSIGRYLNLSYSYKEDESFDENSYCVELTGIRKETLLEFAKKICLILGQDVLVKPYEDSEIIFIDDFDRRWERKFGKPQTRVMAVEDFDEWWREIMDFE